MSTGKLDCHGVTDPGRQRIENEDQVLIADLVELANAGGGADNITVVVARFLDPISTPKQLETEVALQPPKPKPSEEDPRTHARQLASETRTP